MNPLRRHICVASLLLTAAGSSMAQEFPTRPITLVVPYSAGPTDAQYRKLAELASRSLGQPIVIENKPGGNGTIGPVQMARLAKPDGYTVAASTVSLLRQPHMQPVDWNPLNEFTWIIGLGGYTFAIAVRDDSPLKSLKDMIVWAKANPGQLTYGTPGQGSSLHLLMEALAHQAGFQAVHVPFKGGGETTTAMLGGHVMVTLNNVGSVITQAEARKVRILNIFDAERLSRLPDVPTSKELGYDIIYSSPYGLVGPRNMPGAVVKRLHDAFKTAMETPDNKALLDNLYQVPWYRSTEQYTKWTVEAYQQERRFVERAGLLKQP
ncbi:tripartite tricarboxylate transporter substrate binding protein [Hydrogenophaga aromaticivorans]|nr:MULTISPECIES: tripartite tricarboxylate transporter substrate binding protein [Hydrogenophaga]EWS65071.1 Argininosuccinate lyase [Hydrogenophaga sp. T4]MBQ0922215.1 tripartite tricarboxylate transporter substrate binding protein [Hydrogenophaga aromaticivorans]MBT9466545.1 tripartite tricarboxylate transporter substrate binding protein [Hydrogenophaga sp.]MDZ4143375.1 tripartite tricarboxylate transporter substrate binding protein [Burkholderiales bacterium]